MIFKVFLSKESIFFMFESNIGFSIEVLQGGARGLQGFCLDQT